MSKKSSLSLQCWVEKYLQVGGSSFFSYLGAKADERGEVDGLLIMFSAIVLGRVITIISSSGVWSTDNTINHDIVLIHKGGNIFLDTDIGNLFRKYVPKCLMYPTKMYRINYLYYYSNFFFQLDLDQVSSWNQKILASMAPMEKKWNVACVKLFSKRNFRTRVI